MKKLILSLFIFCSMLLQAQIQIPQVVGLPAALSGKEARLPSTPSNPESRFLNGNKQWAEIVLGSGGYASNVYFTNLTSTIVGSYKQTSGAHELTETIASGTCNNNEVLIHTYLFEQPVGITTIDAGVWRITLNSIIDAAAGDSKFKFVQYKRSAAGVETDMFTVYSNTIENRAGYEGYLNNVFETVQPSFTVEATDRLGCRVYATTTAAGNRTLSYKVGDGFASYLNTPLALGHNQLRRLNVDPNNQHVTTTQISTWNTTSANNTVDETLTSIKTKLGAATAVSDGYLKYQDFALLHAPTTVTASNGLSISGQNISLQNASLSQSGALTFNDWNTFNSKEPSFSKNTAFNKNFGTTTGTVLEGRTFGTAANNNTADFLSVGGGTLSGTSPNLLTINRTNSDDNISIKFVGATISNWMGYAGGVLKTGTSSDISTQGKTVYHSGNLTNNLSTNYIPKWNGSNFVNSLISDDGNRTYIAKVVQLNDNYQIQWGNSTSMIYGNGANGTINLTGNIKVDNSTTSTLPTNGALVVNGGVGVGGVANLGGSRISGDGILSNGAGLELFYTASNKTSYIQNYHRGGDNLYHPIYIGGSYMQMDAGNVGVGYATDQGYKLAVNGTGFFNGAVTAPSFSGNGSNLTGVQLPITLTTNGTSGAATFSGNVLNVPNYGSGTGGAYTCTPTNVTNLTSSSIGMALYTKTGSVYRVSISGLINPTASGTCVIRLPMPTNISGGVVPMCYSSSNFTTPQGWSVSAGSNYIDLSINTDGADCQFYANIAYVY